MLRCSSDSLLRTVNEEFYFINAINSLGALHFSRWRTTGKYSNKTRERERESKSVGKVGAHFNSTRHNSRYPVPFAHRAKLFPIFAGEEDRRASHENFLLSKIAGLPRPVDFYVAHTVFYISFSLSLSLFFSYTLTRHRFSSIVTELNSVRDARELSLRGRTKVPAPP